MIRAVSTAIRRYVGVSRSLAMAAVWFSLGKKVRARNRWRMVFGANAVLRENLIRARAICERHDRLDAGEIAAMKAAIGEMVDPPLISVVMPVYDTEEKLLREAIASVRAQLYPHWELCIADDASPSPRVRAILEQEKAADRRIRVVYRETNGHISEASNSALEIVGGAYVALMDHDDTLPRHALYHVAAAIVADPKLDLIYSDEDKIRADGHFDGPHFKPDWNEELFLTQNYINHLGVYRTTILREIGGFRKGFEGSQDHDLVLRFIARSSRERIHHIPRILYHWRAFHGSGSFSDRSLHRAIESRQRAVREYLAATRPGLSVSVIAGPYGCNRLIRELPDPAPKVSIVIPTRDRVDLLAKCLMSIFAKTAYPNYEAIVVDNQSSEAETHAYFAEVSARHPVRVIPYDAPFNYSAMNNLAVAAADGDVVVMLNNDIEVIGFEWLRELVAYAIQPEVGAVGARLLYGSGAVQHAGVVLGVGGIANHAHHGYGGNEAGYQSRLQLPQYVSAVTGACLAVEKKKFLAAGGLDEVDLKVAFNDVDLCLTLSKMGLENVYDPYAVLFHHESQSRGADVTPERVARLERESEFMRGKWGDRLRLDPYYNPNFSQADACFRIPSATN